MARARNIKPSIMDNEELADLSPLTRLLFVYLWMLADREGRLEDRPKRIAAQALAYDRKADVNTMLTDLERTGFISRYSACHMACIQILSFPRHQTPHGTERDSSLPGPDGMFTVHVRGKNGYSTGESKLVGSLLTVKKPSDNTLNPDSGFLIPDSLIVCVGDTPAHTQAKKEFMEALKSRPELHPETVYQGFLAYYPPDKRTMPKWVKWVASEKPAATGPLPTDPDSRASIEALALSRGLGKWNEMERWDAYASRVKGIPA